MNGQENAQFLHEPCGNVIWKRAAKMIMRNPDGCYICSGKNKWKTTESFQNELISKFGEKYTLIGEYEGARTPTLVKNNECGHEYMISPDNLLRGRGCSFHSIQYSSFMKHTEEILKRNNISFVREKRFSDCINPKTGRTLPFDYYLDEHNVLIEVDGQFHFLEDGKHNPWWNAETKYRDELKTQYCSDHDIKLICLPYYEKENFESIILHNLYADTEVTQDTKYDLGTVTHSD